MKVMITMVAMALLHSQQSHAVPIADADSNGSVADDSIANSGLVTMVIDQWVR